MMVIELPKIAKIIVAVSSNSDYVTKHHTWVTPGLFGDLESWMDPCCVAKIQANPVCFLDSTDGLEFEWIPRKCSSPASGRIPESCESESSLALQKIDAPDISKKGMWSTHLELECFQLTVALTCLNHNTFIYVGSSPDGIE